MDRQARKIARICDQSELDPVRYGGCTAWGAGLGVSAGLSGPSRCRSRMRVPFPATSR